jgi:hypothetical protein
MTLITISFFDIIDRHLKEGDKIYFKRHCAIVEDGALRYKNRYFSGSLDFSNYIKKLIKSHCDVRMSSFKIQDGNRVIICTKSLFFDEGTEFLYGGEIGVLHDDNIHWSDKIFNSLDKFIKCIYNLSCYEKYSFTQDCELYFRLSNMEEFEKW